MGRYQEGPALEGDHRYCEGKSPHIEKTRPHHRTMARQIVAGGLRPGEAARLAGISASQMSVIMGSPAFQAELKRLEDGADIVAYDVHSEIKMMVPTAVENLHDDLEMDVEMPEDRRIRQKASLEVLGLAGIKRSDKTLPGLNISGGNVQINVKDLSDDELRRDILELTDTD